MNNVSLLISSFRKFLRGKTQTQQMSGKSKRSIDCEMFDFSGVNEFDGESLVSHERESMDWPHNANANLDHKLTMAPQLILL